MAHLIKTTDRVIKYGEVFTPPWMVNAMLDLVGTEVERIGARILDPACGTGNFLAEALRRKLASIPASAPDADVPALMAVSDLYGIDVLADNISEARAWLLSIVREYLSVTQGMPIAEKYLATLAYILGKNIIWGNSLNLMLMPDEVKPIIVSEWLLVDGVYVKRRDFVLSHLVSRPGQPGLFSHVPVAEYPPVPYLEVSTAYEI